MRGIVFVVGVSAVLVGIVVRFIGGPHADSTFSHRGSTLFAAVGRESDAAAGREVEVVLGTTDNTMLAADIIGSARADGARMRREVGVDIARDLLSPSVTEPAVAQPRDADTDRGDATNAGGTSAADPADDSDAASSPPASAATDAPSALPKAGEPVLSQSGEDGASGDQRATSPLQAEPRRISSAQREQAVRRAPEPRPASATTSTAKGPSQTVNATDRPTVRPEPRPSRPPVQIASVQPRPDTARAAPHERPATAGATQLPTSKGAVPVVSPTPRPASNGKTAAAPAPQIAARTTPGTPSPVYFEAQQILGRLGYNIGSADGRDGSRTRSAVRAFQAANGLKADGTVSDGLLVLLRRQLKARMQQLSEASPGTAEGTAKSENSTWVMAAARGLQRLLGRDFNSVQAPGEIRTYCRANPETWVYDEGRGKLVLCATVVSARSSGSEELALRP